MGDAPSKYISPDTPYAERTSELPTDTASRSVKTAKGTAG